MRTLLSPLLASVPLLLFAGMAVAAEPVEDHRAGPASTEHSEALPEPESERESPEPGPDPLPSMPELLAYATAVQLHLASDPPLAAAYIAFWQKLTEAGDPGELNAGAVAGALSASTRVAETLSAQRQASASYRLADVLELTLALAGGRELSREGLLEAVDTVILPRVLSDGRYDFTGSLSGPADLGFAPDVWLRCRSSPACVIAHDQVFGGAMGGVSMVAALEERVRLDARLAALEEWPLLLAGARDFEARVREGGDVLGEVAKAVANEAFQAVTAGISPALAGSGPPKDPLELGAMLAIGRSSAWLAGSPKTAAAFGVVGPPVLEFAALAKGGVVSSTFLGATAGFGLLLAGVHALSLFEPGGALPPRELERLVAVLRDSTYSNLVALRAESQLSSNLLDTRLVRLGLALDVVKDDVARIESAQRARLRAEFLAQDARRWTAFEEDNDRCFSLRNRDPATGRLRPAEFRRCEDRFLQGAVRRSQYATRARDFVLDSRYIEAAELRFPFRHHYPLLLTLGGMDTAAALALNDPFEWQQHAAALLRLYQENPATRAEFPRRIEALNSLRQAGSRVHEALVALAVQRTGKEQAVFREEVHALALDQHLDSLKALIRRVETLDDPGADPFGKRLTVGLDQPLPEGARRAALETTLSRARDGLTGLQSCNNAPPGAFLVSEAGLSARSRRFFGTPITTEELARSWNREAVGEFGLAPESYAALVPLPFLWASLDGLGELEICFALLRPRSVDFTRDDLPLRNHLRGEVVLEAAVEVYFKPGPDTAWLVGLDPRGPPVRVARHEAVRHCSFGYRADGEGCSRGQCLATLAPKFWAAQEGESLNGGTCSREPMPEQLARNGSPGTAEDLAELSAALARQFWNGRRSQLARLEADVRRSSEFETASANYLRLFALGGVTLGTWPDASGPLAPLFTPEDPLSPRAIVAAMLEGRVAPEALAAGLETRRDQVLLQVEARGREVAAGDALYRLPQFGNLRETLARIDLMLAAYR
jgi:hypothetical protein